MDVNRGIEVGLEHIPRTRADRLEELTDTRWQELAVCRGTNPNVFFTNDTDTEKMAKKLCAICEVRTECLEYALLTNQDDGVWGGRNTIERRRMRRQLRAQ